MENKNKTEAKAEKKTKEKNLNEEKLYLGLINNFEELNVLNLYNMEFCRELTQENYEVVLSYTNPWCLDYYAFLRYLVELSENNLEYKQAYDGFVEHGIKVIEPKDKRKCFIPRLDIFEGKQYVGVIPLGLYVEKIKGKVVKFAHSVFLAREDAKEKLQTSRAKAYSKIIDNPELKLLLDKEVIKDSFNPEKYPIVGISPESTLKLLNSTHFV